MSFPTRELVLLILQLLDKEKFKKIVHELEQESALFFNMKYFEEIVQAGEWDEVEHYLSGFTKVEDNRYSTKIFFEIRKHKYLEALDRNDRVKAAEILVKDLTVFSIYNEEVFKEIAHLLTLDNFRQNEKLSDCGDTKSARTTLFPMVKMLIKRNPLIRGKVTLPTFEASRLQTLIHQSLQVWKNPLPNPVIKPRILDIVGKGNTWKPPDIVDSVHLKALRLPDPLTVCKVMRLIYTNSGLSLLALTSNAVHKLWKWQHNERNQSLKSSASSVPDLWRPKNGALMCNDISKTKPVEESATCIALSKNDYYLLSTSGGKVSLFNMRSFKVMTSFMPPPPAATFLVFHPRDNNIIAVGMEDSTIQIYNAVTEEVIAKLKGHEKQITGLAFSQKLNLLVSSAADAKLCVWIIDRWTTGKAIPIQAPLGHSFSLVGETKLQFHYDQLHLLVVHQSLIAIYDYRLICIKLWSPRDSLSAAISNAIYSCDGLLVITGFIDGAVGVFDADSLSLRCRIAPSAYIYSSIPFDYPYPVVIAAHPSDPTQFALGMTDGSVYVIEPSDGDPTRDPSDSK